MSLIFFYHVMISWSFLCVLNPTSFSFFSDFICSLVDSVSAYVVPIPRYGAKHPTRIKTRLSLYLCLFFFPSLSLSVTFCLTIILSFYVFASLSLSLFLYLSHALLHALSVCFSSSYFYLCFLFFSLYHSLSLYISLSPHLVLVWIFPFCFSPWTCISMSWKYFVLSATSRLIQSVLQTVFFYQSLFDFVSFHLVLFFILLFPFRSCFLSSHLR